ncbi:MAG: hypothetical protein DRP45_11695 [Candidatus Zixiibacteriota bacterium]|nr:MAG: hypothetical protein DRP45_11695 [candidate division Zixibacteria bacterium]
MSENNVIAFSNASNLPSDPAALANLGVAASTMATAGDGVDILRLLRDGAWVFGAENIEPEEDSRWAINPYSFKHGHIAWADSKVHGEIMVPIMQPMPPRSELGDAPEGWSEQISFLLQCVGGEDEGQVVEFKTTSVGGKRAATKMATSISGQAQENPEYVVPVIVLNTDSYQHKKYGKIYTPIFDIAEWASIGDATDKVEAKPEGRKRSR